MRKANLILIYTLGFIYFSIGIFFMDWSTNVIMGKFSNWEKVLIGNDVYYIISGFLFFLTGYFENNNHQKKSLSIIWLMFTAGLSMLIVNAFFLIFLRGKDWYRSLEFGDMVLNLILFAPICLMLLIKKFQRFK